MRRTEGGGGEDPVRADGGPGRDARLAAAAFAALLVGIGFGRFAYTALVPVLIREGWTDVAGAGYLAAANFAGYFTGAILSGAVARLGRLPTVARLGFLLSSLAYAASSLNLGFAWLAFWRFVPGFTGAVMMVLLTVAVLARLPAAKRARAVGLVFTGIGLGIAVSGILVPWLAGLGVAVAWRVLAAASLLATLATWPVWTGLSLPAGASPGTGPAASVGARAPLLLLFAAYALDAAGFVPHTVYWVDFVARGLERGFGVGGTLWILFGIGAMAGPMAVGRLAGRIGFGRAFVAMLAVKAGAVALPLAATSMPALVVSSLVVGALTPGIATLAAGYAGEIAGPARQRVAWGWMTTGFAAVQALAASGFARLLGVRHDYFDLFLAGALLLALAALVAEACRRRARRPA